MNKFLILAIAFASVAGIGILGTYIAVEVQGLADFATLDAMPDSICSCPDDNGVFSPTNCGDFAEPGGITDPNGICKSIAPEADYGSPSLGIQGCGVGFWASQTGDGTLAADVWPSGYSPNYYYNEMFHTTFTLSSFGLNNDKVKNSEEVTEESQEAEVISERQSAEESQEAEVTEESQEAEVTEERQSAEESQEAEVTEESQEAEVITERQSAEESQEAEVTEESQEAEVTEESQEAEVTEESQSAEESQEAEVTEESQSAEESQEAEVTEESQSAEESQEAEVTEENEISDEQKILPRPQPASKEYDENVHGPNLLQALQLPSGNLNDLIRESVAAMLNSAHDEVEYPFTVAEIMSMVQIAIADGDYDKTIKSLKAVNDKNNSPICKDFILSP